MNLRIAHVTATFPPYQGGTGNVCRHNARELARRGHDMHVFTAIVPGAAAYEVNDGITVHRLPVLVRFGNAPVLPGLLASLRGFDVIHLHYPFFGGEFTTLAARLSRTPLVVTYHQDVFLGGLAGLVAKMLRLTAGRLTLCNASRVLFTSTDYGCASYVRPMLRGHENAIDELPNGVDLELFNPHNSCMDMRMRHGLSEGDRVVLLVAGLDRAHSFKGIDIFLQSLALLQDNVKGVIVGDGDLRAAYMMAAQKLGIAERVIFAGRVSDEELARYYRLADVTTLPSVTMGEAFGLVLVESLASGTPVVASDLPGVRTVVNDGQDGFLVQHNSPPALAEAIQRLLGDNALRLAMGRAGRAKVEHRYSWERIGTRLEQIYQGVLEDPKWLRTRIHLEGGQ